MDVLPAIGWGEVAATVRFEGRAGNAASGGMLIEESDYPLSDRAEKR